MPALGGAGGCGEEVGEWRSVRPRNRRGGGPIANDVPVPGPRRYSTAEGDFAGPEPPYASPRAGSAFASLASVLLPRPLPQSGEERRDPTGGGGEGKERLRGRGASTGGPQRVTPAEAKRSLKEAPSGGGRGPNTRAFKTLKHLWAGSSYSAHTTTLVGKGVGERRSDGVEKKITTGEIDPRG